MSWTGELTRLLFFKIASNSIAYHAQDTYNLTIMTASQSLCSQHHYRSVCPPCPHKCVYKLWHYNVHCSHISPPLRTANLLLFYLCFYIMNCCRCHTGAPVLKSVSDSVTGAFMDCHMMVADPARVCPTSILCITLYTFFSYIYIYIYMCADWFAHSFLPRRVYLQWVKDVADAGGKSYTFHIEATGEGTSRTL